MLDHTDSHPGGYEELHGVEEPISSFVVTLRLIVAFYDPFGFWRAFYRH